MVATSTNYDRILILGIRSSTAVAKASHSSMLEIALLHQTWNNFESLCKQHGYDVFKAWAKELQGISLQLRKQLMYLNIAQKISEVPVSDWLTLATDEAKNDQQVLRCKGKTYGDSWKKRGGIGAFMMLCRKWDRIENIMGCSSGSGTLAILRNNTGDVQDDIADLRRYLLLVEDEMAAVACGELPGAGYVNQD